METVEIEFEGTYFTVELINNSISRITTNADLSPFLKIIDYANIKRIAQDKRVEDESAELNYD